MPKTSKPRMVKKYTGEAMELSQQISREEYKAIKRMDKVQLTAYLQRIYLRGCMDGVTATAETAAREQKPEETATEE